MPVTARNMLDCVDRVVAEISSFQWEEANLIPADDGCGTMHGATWSGVTFEMRVADITVVICYKRCNFAERTPDTLFGKIKSG